MDYLISKETMLSILTNYGLDVAQKIKKNQEINKNLNERIDELRKMLESNGDTDLQLEYEQLHKIAERKLPDDYEALHN